MQSAAALDEPAPGEPARPGLSVVLRTKTRETEVLDVIKLLFDQDRVPDEIVIVDSGSAPEILAGLEELRRTAPAGCELRVHPIPPKTYQSARALNQGLGWSRFEYVGIISQDALPADRHYLSALTGALDADPTLAGAYGRQILKDHYDPLGEKDLLKTYPPESRDQVAPECWFVNTCSIVRKSVWQRHPFAEAAHITEDHEWARWAQSNGYKVRYEARAIVRHYHHYRTFSEVWSRYYEETEGLSIVYNSQPHFFKSMRSAVRDILSDWAFCLPRGHFGWALASPAWRLVKHLALWQGLRAASARRRSEAAAAAAGSLHQPLPPA